MDKVLGGITLPDKCTCCKTNNVGKTTVMCDNCWDWLMPDKGKDGITWEDIWVILCHWHAVHDEKDKDFEFAHDVVLTAYSHKRFYCQDDKALVD